MCTRVLYETGSGTYIVGRSMDWSDLSMSTDCWTFPRGMERDGGVGPESASWTSKYGSAILTVYELATSDGMNEAGLAGNLLYLAEAEFGDPEGSGKPTISVGAFLQYLLDNFATVAEAVAVIEKDPLRIITASAPNGRAASVHFAISDPSGDSAIIEYVGGKPHIHHGPEFAVMTNSPLYDQQLAINEYWEEVGGLHSLPGTISAADRFVRASYALKSSPRFEDRREALAAVFSQMRSIGVPLGMSDPDKPNISSTLWRTVIDHDAKRYYFESVINPAVEWLDLETIDFSPDASPAKARLGLPENAGGDFSSRLEIAEPFKFLAP